MQISSPNETKRLFTMLADETNDANITLPIVALRRVPSTRILSTNKKPLTFDGYRKNNNGQKIDQLNAIPIHIEYQLDIYTRYYDEADDYMRNFVFNFINYPKLQIEIPYNSSNIVHTSNIRITDEITDNSDIPERLAPGQFTRLTLHLYIDDAYLFDYRTKDALKVEIEDIDITLKPEIDVYKDTKNKEKN